MQQHFLFSGDEVGDWRLDEHTKTVGRQGIAAARAILGSREAPQAVAVLANAA